ncbi:hypothetical protein E2C01_058506 [Portunus trituberculatus]|uniref:Uncharacterized protein n=1 Tax=Portunus trituberculatus TaxID=210409 RepID=A0A5B7GVR6_PORTR|nr:hypothetical protein [Portunus trituberculatus]
MYAVCLNACSRWEQRGWWVVERCPGNTEEAPLEGVSGGKASSPVGPRVSHDAPATTTTTTTTVTASTTGTAAAGTATMQVCFFNKRPFGALVRKAPVWSEAPGRGEGVFFFGGV